MKRSFLFSLLLLGLIQPAHALCVSEVLKCARTAPLILQLEATNSHDKAFIPPPTSGFTLERHELSSNNKIDLRPSWRLDDDTRVSVKVKRSQVELRMRKRW
ncbi:hypothetical protein [Vogesella alkaliphila]|uniref:Secreted protein n=1 Tax=Vogesella alkaliphila TaxID=1193621 RepID=A0ABQ2YHQ8_9NEIS|nr:hypothetical protein [Vogesella alkaliphila]GGX84691.1 hypothetical protein GCM10011290_10510 [Vogesella alkaliphila]